MVPGYPSGTLSGPGPPGGVWGGNPIEKAGLAGIGAKANFHNINICLLSTFRTIMCGNVLSNGNVVLPELYTVPRYMYIHIRSKKSKF